MTETAQKPKPDPVQFYDSYTPALAGGTYEIAVSHAIKDKDNKDIPTTPIPIATQRFVVRGPRFTLMPTDIYAQFPPAGSSGRYAEKLPHVVLTKRVLPWERSLSEQHKPVPWMALLLLEEGEIIGGDANSDTGTITSTVEDALTKNALTKERLNDTHEQVIKPEIALDTLSKEEKQLKCRTVEISGKTFQMIVPHILELPYLAHCRRVNTDYKESLGLKDDGWFSVVIGNRFPRVQNAAARHSGKNIAHLVSLEGFQHLVSLEGFQKYLEKNPPNISDGTRVRLFSLASWSFVCVAEGGQTFHHLVEHFVKQEAGKPQNLLLKLPVEPPGDTSSATPQAIAQDYLSRGYVALNYQTVTGDATFAWYRGPLVPEVTAPVPKSDHFYTAAAAMIYDRRLGLFDHSLAAAWQIGRSLALADATFATNLLRFWRQAHYLTDLLMERLQFFHLDISADSPDLKELLQKNLIHQRFIELLKEKDIVSRVGQHSRQTIPQPPSSGRARYQAVPLATNPVEVLKNLLEQEEVKALMGQMLQEELAPVARWLAQLQLLNGVPFHHLVPHPGMLPQESLRFFYLDQNWIEAMTDGALASCVQTSRDVLFQGMMKNVVSDAVKVVTLQLRAAQDDKKENSKETATPTDTPITGVLLRSALVWGWPGLTIQARKHDQPVPLQMLRMQRLSPSVMLCLFPDVPDELEMSEPHEGLQFGVNEKGEIELRSLTGTVGEGKGPLKIYDPSEGKLRDGYIRPNSDRVLNIKAASGADLVAAMTQELKAVELTPSGFALQMIRAPGRITFKSREGGD